ncbi:MAG: hypothetical protein GXP19_06000 [Gammaproteobacteria bacterium]|nr:hypothetical protein [Gammaproteobacteria bacterium]
MKLAFIFMLLLNIVFFGWQFSQSDSPALIPKSNDTNGNSRYKTIALLHETDQSNLSKNETIPGTTSLKEKSITTRVDEAKLEVENLAKNEITNCFKLGPYSVKLNATRSLDRIKSYGALANIYLEEKKERFRYWVLIPTSNKQAAIKKIKKFKEKGVEDVYLIREGKKKGDISLGIFRARSTAQKRILNLKKLGFNPTVEKHYKIRNEFWLTIKETIRSPLTNSAWEDIIGGFEDIKKQEEPCN